MNKENGNELAFPMFNELGNLRAEGLTKREYFAAMAMQGLLANSAPEVVRSEISIAQMAVSNADELLKQLDNE